MYESEVVAFEANAIRPRFNPWGDGISALEGGSVIVIWFTC